jgi:hypothetical protein
MSFQPSPIHLLSAALPELAAEARSRSLEFEERRQLAPDFVDKLNEPASSGS